MLGGLLCLIKILNYISHGKMPEWLNGTVSKTVYRLVRYEGSNPSLSARQNKCPAGWRGIFHLEACPGRPAKRTKGKIKSARAPAQVLFFRHHHTDLPGDR